MAETKQFVRIQSSKTIAVTCGLQNQDVTNPDAHIADRLKVSPLWPKATVLIREGAGIYPSEIAEWATVKALAKDKILTIGEYLDNAENSEQVAEKETLKAGLEEIEAVKARSKKAQSLADIAK